ncbi:hypothetical protein DXG03_008409 [Asterophora parasitica]|uniref:non-specific serine/threonine protein kinase n=1 Tax=Asterophora parasitica TaxID=117018 RepID=A0A9P7KHD6_9AGAR|nr:hypothetical protein DXG03_008409 [Asterophora parasitica]
MLSEVKKEVDVMRLLKGHPNIVHLIDAAWHKMPNGMHEVFILMEFCPGGGIIDMMNRRLRERLTEAEILQIFVDVCEGVAYMHNLRPALLHRDLKVENILQSSSTSYKLCDFGSATTVSRPPATTQEIRALEADLNRHTTLQYRAPEMVDVYSRRPVDEKSDVWALGVLLYKLCYYTTPFEEHGQLAILNVQYRIPPYPVYSPQMNQLIEHGSRRPSVFELLSHVHRLRGTKSRFKYTIPVPQPLSPRQQGDFRPSLDPPANKVPMSVSPSRGQGVQAREKVMEAIAPMRRGEQTFSPDAGSSSADPQNLPRRGRPSAKEPQSMPKLPSHKSSEGHVSKPGQGTNWLGDDFMESSESWKSMASNDARGGNGSADVWKLEGKEPKTGGKTDNLGFGDDFAEKLWDSVGGSKPEPQPNPTLSRKPSLPTRQYRPVSTQKQRSSPDKDAFEGLGLATSSLKPAPTLAEARKLRTGMATMNPNGFHSNLEKPAISRPALTPSPRQPPPQLQLYPSSVVSSSSTNLLNPTLSKLTPQPISRKGTPAQTDGLSAESRFPSLEELDASFTPDVTSNPSSGSHQAQEKSYPISSRNGVTVRLNIGDGSLLKPDIRSHGREGTRSEQVTGVAMRESRSHRRVPVDTFSPEEAKLKPTSGSYARDENNPSRPSLTRKHRSSVTVKHPFELGSVDREDSAGPSSSSTQTAQDAPPRLPPRKIPKDWLTGDDDFESASPISSIAAPAGETPVLRESPSKRASVIQRSALPIPDAVSAQHDHVEQYTQRSPSPTPAIDAEISPTFSRFTRAFPPIDASENSRESESGSAKRIPVVTRTVEKPPDVDSTSSGEEEGPEDAIGSVRPIVKAPPQRRGHKGRQSSVHDLVDLYGGGITPKEKERDARVPPINSESSRLKGQTIGTAATISSKSATSVSTSSPWLSVDIGTSSRQPTPTERRNRGTPSPQRSRPQSMFIFPSKSTDSYAPGSAGQPSTPSLAPPEDGKYRIRRTSITDMVQRYENIGGGVKSVEQDALSPVGAPRTAIKLAGMGDNRFPRSQTTIDKERGISNLPATGDYEPGRRPRSPIDMNRASPAPQKSPALPIPLNTLKEAKETIPRLPKPETTQPRFPSRKVTDDSSSQPVPESGSSSPERPYQGVGKLIDQWQRKTAEAEPPRTVLKSRGTFVAKRI